MGFYWRRSTKILPGVKINWSKSGPSVSVGPRGAKLNFSKRGTYASGSIPGTGMYYRQKIGFKKQSNTSYNQSYDPSAPFDNNVTNQQFSSKGCAISVIVLIIIALVFTANYITVLVLATICLVGYFFYKKPHSKSIPQSQNVSSPPQVNSASQQSISDPANPITDRIDIKVAVAEVEHLIKEIDNSSDKVKLPSSFRKLMSIIAKMEKETNVEIQGLPIVEVKRRVLENYRKKMN